jgi:hypothetical protein
MTALSKAALQALWVQFFQPTQADFANLIDSWTDYSPALEVFGAKVSGGSTGVPNVVSSTSVAFVALGATGSDLMGAGTAASARTVLGFGATGSDLASTGTAASARTVLGVVSATESLAGLIEIATQAEANTGSADDRALTPAKLASISPTSVTFDASDQVLILDASDSNKLKRATITSGKVIQQAYAGYSAYATGTTTIPVDDTIPQNTEGVEFMSVSITPTSINNFLMIEVVAMVLADSGYVTGAVFRDSIADALCAGYTTTPAVFDGTMMVLRHRMAAPSTSAMTFKFRAGNDTGNIFFNGRGGRFYGNITKSSITITEIAP